MEYLPPEILSNSGEFNCGKIDIYSWGITIYQLITGKTVEELSKEVASFKYPGTEYTGFLRLVQGIKIKGDTEGYVSSLISGILLLVLDISPLKRPTFAVLKEIFGGSENPAKTVDKMNGKIKLENETLKSQLSKTYNEVCNYAKKQDEMTGEINDLKQKLDHEKANNCEIQKLLDACKAELKLNKNGNVLLKEKPINLSKKETKKIISSPEKSIKKQAEKIKINIKTSFGENFPFYVEPKLIIMQLKEMIEKNCGIEVGKQKLIFHGNERLTTGLGRKIF